MKKFVKWKRYRKRISNEECEKDTLVEVNVGNEENGLGLKLWVQEYE